MGCLALLSGAADLGLGSVLAPNMSDTLFEASPLRPYGIAYRRAYGLFTSGVVGVLQLYMILCI